ncbi:MAG TPA: LON peptidase substrate-binding domain-containing protein [Steroidobacteraceae bacterium]|nr:LON peptidase substrate-binding domain-containing protein [Steroidobacteraceae bacterium]
MTAPGEIALFPLRTVLFPGGPLALRIFEPRYLDMVRGVLRTQSDFGVLQILSGGEVGAAQTVDIGTGARIVDFSELPDGLLGISCRGTRRFRVKSRRLERDGLNVGVVDWLDEPAPTALPAEFAPLGQLAQALLAEFTDAYAGVEPRLDDADWVGYRLSEILPLSPSGKQRALELDDAVARLELLAAFTAGLSGRRQARDA